MAVPILFIVFNRPDPTAKVFEAIKATKTDRLYVAADGPRSHKAGEEAVCSNVRSIATQVTWPCQLKTRFLAENVGCRRGVQEAIDWFFQHEEEGIILEDDCLPHPDFFEYCKWALEAFRKEKTVWHIGGSNFLAPRSYFEGHSLAFQSIAQVWGWATWRDRWSHYQANPFYLADEARTHQANWLTSQQAKLMKNAHIQHLKHGLDTWDYQWQITILNHQGLCLVPAKNLISNLGNGPEATHTFVDKRANAPLQSLPFPLQAPPFEINPDLTRWFELQTGLRSAKKTIKHVLEKSLLLLKSRSKDALSWLLFKPSPPIVVASSGRNGSTLLFNAIAISLVKSRYRLNETSWLGRFFIERAKGDIVRLDKIAGAQQPILKTHDLYDPKRAPNAKYIFVYGDPLESAQSAEQRARRDGLHWLDEHLYNLRSHGDISQIFQKDILNFEKQLKAWAGQPNPHILPIPFEALWDSQREISEFVGFEVELPPKRERRYKPPVESLNQELFDRLRSEMRKVANRGTASGHD